MIRTYLSCKTGFLGSNSNATNGTIKHLYTHLKTSKRCLHSNKPPHIASSEQSLSKRFWKWTTQERVSWKSDYKEGFIICTVFAITGSSTLYFVRPMLKNIGIEGSLYDGPNSYRVASVLLISPIYACILFSLGTISGRHNFFASMAHKIIGRFLFSSKLKEKILCSGAKSKISM